MDWRGALRSRLTGLAGGRVYWASRPQTSALPAIVLTMVSDSREQHLKGFMDLQPGRVQIDCYADKDPFNAWSLAEAVIAAVVPAATTNGHIFSRAFVDIAPRDLIETQANITIFRVSMDLIFHHAEEEGS